MRTAMTLRVEPRDSRVATIVAEIANASNKQATGLDQINKALTQLDEVTQQNSALREPRYEAGDRAYPRRTSSEV
jgi:hypothetical protein